MQEGIIVGVVLIGFIGYLLLRMKYEEQIGIDSMEKKIIANTVIRRCENEERIIPLYAFRDLTMPRSGIKKIICKYYALGICNKRIYITPFIVKNNVLMFDKTSSFEKEDVLRIEGSSCYVDIMYFHFHLKNGQSYAFSMEASNVKTDNRQKVNIQQKEELQEAYQIIDSWRTEINSKSEPHHPKMNKTAKFFYGMAKIMLSIGVIGLVVSIFVWIFGKNWTMYREIEKYSTMALSLGFFISLFSWFFGALFDTASESWGSGCNVDSRDIQQKDILIDGQYGLYQGKLYRLSAYGHDVELFAIDDIEKQNPIIRVSTEELGDRYDLHTHAVVNGLDYWVQKIEQDMVTYERVVGVKELCQKKINEFDMVYQWKARTGQNAEKSIIYIKPGVNENEFLNRRFIPEEMYNGHIMLSFLEEEMGVMETLNMLEQCYGKRLQRTAPIVEMLMCDYYIETIKIDDRSFCLDCDWGIVTISPDGDNGDHYIREIADYFNKEISK